jgi:hypothetical protein
MTAMTSALLEEKKYKQLFHLILNPKLGGLNIVGSNQEKEFLHIRLNS